RGWGRTGGRRQAAPRAAGHERFDGNAGQEVARAYSSGMPSGPPRALEPHVVQPALRGSFGQEYHWAAEAATTQRMLPLNAAHGAVALAERQTEGRGRLGRRWVDSALMFSVALYPPQPVAS